MRVNEGNFHVAETHHHKMSTKIVKTNAFIGFFLACDTFVRFDGVFYIICG